VHEARARKAHIREKFEKIKREIEIIGTSLELLEPLKSSKGTIYLLGIKGWKNACIITHYLNVKPTFRPRC